MTKNRGSREMERMQGASPVLTSSSEVPHGHADLLVLRTTIRRLAHIGLMAYDVWASRATPEALELAEDTVKPLLEQLFRDAGYPARSEQ